MGWLYSCYTNNGGREYDESGSWVEKTLSTEGIACSEHAPGPLQTCSYDSAIDFQGSYVYLVISVIKWQGIWTLVLLLFSNIIHAFVLNVL